MQAGVAVIGSIGIACIRCRYCLSAIGADHKVFTVAFQMTALERLTTADTERRMPNAEIAMSLCAFEQADPAIVVVVGVVAAVLRCSEIGCCFIRICLNCP